MTRKFIFLLLTAICLHLPAKAPAQTDDIQKHIVKPIETAIDTRQKTQQEQEAWRLEKEKLIARFEHLQQEQNRLTRERMRLIEQHDATYKRLSQKKKQLSDIEQITNRIQPFLKRLLEELRTQIAEDLPYLKRERQQRLQKLKNMMADPDVDASERYRKIMEALCIEAEYGFSIGTYQETISMDGRPLLVDIFRLGRIGLYYQSLDRKKVGFYNVATDKWEPLPAADTPAIQTAIDIAAKRQPVELLSLPVGRLVTQ